MERLVFGMESLGRLGLYVCVFTLVGAVALRWGVLRSLRSRPANMDAVTGLESRLVRVGLYTAGTLCLLALVRLLLQAYAVFGVDEGITFESVVVVALETPWGVGWRWQFGSALASLIAFSFARFHSHSGWILTLPTTLLAAAALSFGGHAVSMAPAALGIGLQTVHIVAASVWIGSLTLLYVLVLRNSSPSSVGWKSQLIDQFSPIAVGAVACLVGAGVVSAFVYLDTWDQLTGTLYGQLLLTKIVLFGATGSIGLFNWRVVRPRLRASTGADALERTVRLELSGAMFALAATSVLVSLSMEH